MRPRSKKTEALYKERRILVEKTLRERMYCEVRWDEGCTRRSEHLHEPLTRARGGSIVDPDNVIATCWYCHTLLHANPKEAHERGFLKHSWEAD